MDEVFEKVATVIARTMGRPTTFLLCVLLVLVWAASGPIFHFSDTWQLVINTGTTIVTFLMVFLIQNTQNRDARAINLKLNELIHSISTAKDQMIDIEHLSDEELDRIAEKYKLVHNLEKKPHKNE